MKLEGNFLDDVSRSAKKIRKALKGKSEQTRQNGERLIGFMESIVK